MPRSKSAFTTSIYMPGAGRPAPPGDLLPDDAEVWHDIIASMPPKWFDAGAQQILRRAVISAGSLRKIEARLAEIDAVDDEAITLMERYAKLARAFTNLCHALRISPKSRYVPERSAAAARRANAQAARPWQILAPPSDDEDETSDWQ